MEVDPRAPPGLPALGGQGVGGRGHPQQDQDHQLAIVVPARFQEARFGRPAHRERVASVQHPGPVHASEDLVGQLCDLRVGFEVLPAGQDSGHEQGRVDRGKFAPPPALARLHVHEVVEEPVFMGHLMGQEAQGGAHAIQQEGSRSIAPGFGNAKPGQPEAGGRDAGHAALLAPGGPGPIPHLSGPWRGLLPEVAEGSALDLFQQVCLGGPGRAGQDRRDPGQGQDTGSQAQQVAACHGHGEVFVPPATDPARIADGWGRAALLAEPGRPVSVCGNTEDPGRVPYPGMEGTAGHRLQATKFRRGFLCVEPGGRPLGRGAGSRR